MTRNCRVHCRLFHFLQKGNIWDAQLTDSSILPNTASAHLLFINLISALRRLTIFRHYGGGGNIYIFFIKFFNTFQNYCCNIMLLYRDTCMYFMYAIQINILELERVFELSRVLETWLKFRHEYSPYQCSGGSRMKHVF